MLFAVGVDAAGIQVQDLVAVAGRGIELAEIEVAAARRAGLLLLPALHRLEGILAGLDLARRTFEHRLRIRVADLPPKQYFILVRQNGRADAAGMAHDLAHGLGAVL